MKKKTIQKKTIQKARGYLAPLNGMLTKLETTEGTNRTAQQGLTIILIIAVIVSSSSSSSFYYYYYYYYCFNSFLPQCL